MNQNDLITIEYFESFYMRNEVTTGKFHHFSGSRVCIQIENPVRKKVLVPLASVIIT